MFTLKEDLILTRDGIITKNIIIKNNQLIIKESDGDLIHKNNRWYFKSDREYFLGVGAWPNIIVKDLEIIDRSLALNILKEMEDLDE